MTKEEAAIIIHKLKQDVLTGAVRRYEPLEGEVLLSAEFYDAINMAIEALQQEPKVGEWYLDDEWRCSVCNCVCEDWRGIPTYKYCPQCGSYVGKMQEVEE